MISLTFAGVASQGMCESVAPDHPLSQLKNMRSRQTGGLTAAGKRGQRAEVVRIRLKGEHAAAVAWKLKTGGENQSGRTGHSVMTAGGTPTLLALFLSRPPLRH